MIEIDKILEYENALEEIITFQLSEVQIDKLLLIIEKNPILSASQLIELANGLSKNNKILLNAGEFSIDPILNESIEIQRLVDYVIPAITKHIPKKVLCHLDERQVREIIDDILEVEFDSNTTPTQLKKRIDEMFTSGDMSIPPQGLRGAAESVEIIMIGAAAPIVHKAIQFGKELYDKPKKSTETNKNTLKDALKGYKLVKFDDSETPLMKMLPKFTVVLKKLVNGRVKK